MADAVVLDRWSAGGVHLSDVTEAVATLRDQSGAERGSARTAVMTLIGVATADDQAYGATEVLRNLAGHHPARIITIRPDPDGVSSLDARATLWGLDEDHHRITFEEILLEVRGQAARHLDSLVEAFTLSDLPVVVWYVGAVPEAYDPLLPVATAVLIDSRDAPDIGELRSLLALARRRTVVDLSWRRTEPWRELLAALFDPPATREWLGRLDGARVSGKAGPRRLLGGWLVAQTGLAPARIELADTRHVSVQLRAGSAASFGVERLDGQRVVTAEAVVAGEPPVAIRTPLPEDPLGASLAAALTNLRPDPVWERALSAATALTGD